jgi:hypothetical protein
VSKLKIAPWFVFAIIHSELQNARTFIQKKQLIWRFYKIFPPTQGFYEKNCRVLSAPALSLLNGPAPAIHRPGSSSRRNHRLKKTLLASA